MNHRLSRLATEVLNQLFAKEGYIRPDKRAIVTVEFVDREPELTIREKNSPLGKIVITEADRNALTNLIKSMPTCADKMLQACQQAGITSLSQLQDETLRMSALGIGAMTIRELNDAATDQGIIIPLTESWFGHPSIYNKELERYVVRTLSSSDWSTILCGNWKAYHLKVLRLFQQKGNDVIELGDIPGYTGLEGQGMIHNVNYNFRKQQKPYRLKIVEKPVGANKKRWMVQIAALPLAFPESGPTNSRPQKGHVFFRDNG